MKRIDKYIKSSFVKDSSYMVFSTIAMQLIALATLPFLSRMFSPEAFGFHGTFRSTILIISIILTFNLELAVVLPKAEKEKNNIYITSLVTIGLVSLVLICFYGIINVLFNINILSIIFRQTNLFIFAAVLIGSILISLTNLNQARLVSLKRFKKIAESRLILPVVFFIVSIGFYEFLFEDKGLVYAQVIAYFVLFLFLQKNLNINIKGYNFDKFKRIYSKYKEIPLYTFPNSLLNTISLNLPLIILAILYDDIIVGFYAIGIKLVSLPVKFISSSFSQIFYKKAVDTYNNEIHNFYPFVKRVMFPLLFVGIVIFGGIYFCIPYLVPIFLGDQWVDSIVYLQYICFWQALMIVNGPISTITILLKKQKLLLSFQILFLIGRAIALWIPFYLDLGPEFSVLFYALIGVLFNAYLFWFLLDISKKCKKDIYSIS